MDPSQRAALRAHLEGTLLAGPTRTPRISVVSHAEKLAEGDPDKFLGIGARGRDAQGVMDAVAALCGCSASLSERDGPGDIDPERTLDGIAAAGDRLAEAAKAKQRILIATGHPTGVMQMYQAVARTLVEVGVRLARAIEDEPLKPPKRMRRPRWFRYLDGVAVLATPADLLHTHESWPMDRLLDEVGDVDLVLADHGFAGAAITRGLDTVTFTDVNDPAIAVAWADGLASQVVPIDDNRPPGDYVPIASYLQERVTSAN